MDAATDSFAIVALEPIAEGSVLFFSDRRLDGPLFATGPNDGVLQWRVSSAISAGEIVQFRTLDRPVVVDRPADSLLQFGGSRLDLSLVADTLVAYEGADMNSPDVFVAALSTAGADALQPAYTSLWPGAYAVVLPKGTVHSQYVGPRGELANFVEYRAAVCDAAEWSDDFDSFSGPLVTSSAPFVTEQHQRKRLPGASGASGAVGRKREEQLMQEENEMWFDWN